jgi:hypothetical protein
MAVPIPGFVVVGALGGAIVSTPKMQIKASRWMSNSLKQRTSVRREASYGDVILVTEIRMMGRWTKSEEYSYNGGDFWIESRTREEGGGGGLNGGRKEVLCMRSRIKRADAVYLVVDELSLQVPEPLGLAEPRLVEQRRVLNGTVTIATSRREYTLLAPGDGENEGEEVLESGTTGDGRAAAVMPAHGPQLQPSVVSSPLRANGSTSELVLVRSGWLDMKVLVGWSKRWFELFVKVPTRGRQTATPTMGADLPLPRLLPPHGAPYQIGERVEYCSATLGEWIEARVERNHGDGTVTLDCRARADPLRIRPLWQQEPAAVDPVGSSPIMADGRLLTDVSGASSQYSTVLNAQQSSPLRFPYSCTSIRIAG